MKQLFVRAIFLLFYVLLRIIPVCVQPGLARGIGNLACGISGKRRVTMRSNMRIAFRNRYSDEELDAIARRSYQNLVMSVFEFIRFNLYKPQDIERMVDVVGEKHVRAALARGKGIVVISAHFGNWELLAARIHTLGLPMTAVGRNQNDGLINEFIVRLRASKGTKNIARGTPMFQEITSLLRRNELVGLVSDQNAGARGVFADFFGAPASTFKGPGLFALMNGSAVLPVMIVRRGYEKHTAYLGPEITIDPTGDAGRDIAAYCQAINKVIEDYVEKYPDHWLWVHKRWKTRPPGETAFPGPAIKPG
jgi:KDO2-lipid IV(A) lauroyltransferase